MTEFVLSANALTFAQIKRGVLRARVNTSSATVLGMMQIGDLVVPIFDAEPSHGDSASPHLARAVQVLGEDPFEFNDGYRSRIGDGSVPFLLRVTGTNVIDRDGGEDTTGVSVEVDDLDRPLATSDFLRLRALEDAVAAQVKNSMPLNPIIEVKRGLAAAVKGAVNPSRDEDDLLRRLTLVKAASVDAATTLLANAGRAPRRGDHVFLATTSSMLGSTRAQADNELETPRTPIAHTPDAALEILREAQARATAQDPFRPDPAIAAIERIVGLVQSTDDVLVVDDYRVFYEYTVLSAQLTQALAIGARALPEGVPTAPAVSVELADIAINLAGLTVEAVTAELPDGFKLPHSVIATAVTALRAGKHLLLGGPPGTGKTTLAEALCRAVVGANYHVTTATADWTTFDTIGGYIPDDQGLKFSPGVVLRSLRTAGWLVIDEVNRADIDKAFGPLFTVLSGGEGAAGRISTLPYTAEDGPVTIRSDDDFETGSGTYTITPTWRLIGTLNLSDKASLFRLSFAFLRRFAVIDVPLPEDVVYRDLFATWFDRAGIGEADDLTDAAMKVVTGPVAVGPAIGRDLVEFVAQAVADSSSGAKAIADPAAAFVTAVRLFVAPQYEGEQSTLGENLVARIKDALPSLDEATMKDLRVALAQVAVR